MKLPWKVISDFVVNQLPRMLAEAAKELPYKAAELVEALPRFNLSLVTDLVSPLLSLDLKMIETAIVFSSLPVPPRLVMAVNDYSPQEQYFLTYEDLVLKNPVKRTRVFTHGEVGEAERNFYLAHKRIEASLEAARIKLQTAIALLSDEWLVMPSLASTITVTPVEMACEVLSGLEQNFYPLISETANLAQIGPGVFGKFRPYLTTNPFRETKGPSGAFSANVPLIEALVRKQLPSDQIDWLKSNQRYLPQAGAKRLFDAIQSAAMGYSLQELSKKHGRPDGIENAITIVDGYLQRFRSIHLGTVKKLIPEIQGNMQVGTGGETVDFLRKRIDTGKMER